MHPLIAKNMYDTIKIHLANTGLVGDFVDNALKHVDCDSIVLHEDKYSASATAAVGNMRLRITPNALNMVGSLSKWYLGDNIGTLSRGDTQRAVEKLSDTLHQPLESSEVRRIDIAQNILTKYPVEMYLKRLGDVKTYKRLEKHHTGLTYQKNDNTTAACFYDKIEEVKKNRGDIPELYKGRNVLRYEFRWLCKLRRAFKVRCLPVKMLYDEAFYMDVIRKHLSFFDEIPKIRNTSINVDNMKTKRDWMNYVMMAYIKLIAGGEMGACREVAEMQKKGMPRQVAYDIRTMIKELCSKNTAVNEQSEIEEMSEKLHRVETYFR